MRGGRRGRGPFLIKNAARGIHRLGHAYVNCYLVEEGDALTVVDAGLPATWPHFVQALDELGRSLADVRALVLTHAHFDHLGFAARLAEEHRVPVWLHPGDHYIGAHPARYRHERSRAKYPLLYPRSVPLLGAMAVAGALSVKGVRDVHSLAEGPLDVPGNPHVISTPGHTVGHCALHFPDRDAVITGDALVTLDPYRATLGPQLVAGAATADSIEALASLRAIADTGATTLLPGHGEPWKRGAAAAVAAAVAAGVG